MKGRLNLLLAFGALAMICGCQGGKGKKEAEPPKTAATADADDLLAEVAGETPKAPPKVAEKAPPKVAEKEPPKVAKTPTTSSEVDRLFDEMAQKEDGAAAKAEALFAAGKQLFDDQRYKAALQKFNEALHSYPRHLAAARYAARARAILDMGLDPMKRALEQMERKERIRVQESLAEIHKVIEKGNRAREAAGTTQPKDANKPADQVLSRQRRAAEDALGHYDRALEIIRWLPYQVDLSDLRRKVQAAKGETQAAIKGIDSQLLAYQRQQARDAREAVRAREEIFFYRKLQAMLDRARFDYKRSKFEEAEAICEQVLRLDPGNGKALALRAKSREKKHATREAQTYRDYQIEFDSSMQAVEDATVAFSKPLVYPGNWQKIMMRSEQVGTSSETEPDWMTDIRRKLEKKVNFEFVQAPLDEAINFLQHVSDVNMIIDPAVKAAGEKPITLKMTQASLKLSLDWILKLAGLDYELRDNAVYISTPANLRPDTKMLIYDIQDLILAIPDFPGPEMDLMNQQAAAGGAGALPVFGGAGGQAQQATTDAATIVEMIKRRIKPDSWGPAAGADIQERAGKLVVVQRPEVHRMISSLLSDLRTAQKVMVVVEGRLLEIREGLLEDIGVDWGTTAGLPEVPTTTPGLNYQRGALTTMTSAINNNVIFSPDRTTLAATFPYYVNAADGSGGMNAEVRFARGPRLQISAVLHALRVTEDTAELHAPKLVVHNGQRAHMWVGRQRAYVAGWQASGGNATPTVNQLLTGVVFDVRPIVSANRRYITLELRPTFTELLNMPTNTSTQLTATTGSSGVAIVRVITMVTELPDVRISRVRTSVTIPDGGIILTGGRLQDTNFESEAGIPFLKDIPILGRAFRWNRKDHERSNLAILVTARSLLFEEEERKAF